MKKLNLYERLLKNKNKLKVQTISLLLATTSLITTGCGRTENPNVDNPQPGVVDVIDNDDNVVEEEMVPLTVENLDSEAERITNSIVEKGMEVSFEDVRRTLLILNKDLFAEDEFYSLYEIVTDSSQDPINNLFNEITKYNVGSIYDGNPNDLIDLKVFCRSEAGYKVVEKLSYHSALIAKIVVDNPKNLDSEIEKNLNVFYDFLNNEQIKIGNDTFLLYDLDDGTRSLILQTEMFVQNYVNYVCKNASDDTKEYCSNINTLCYLLCGESYSNILSDSISKAGQKTM